ncbi:MAG: DinB family protein [Thermoanaerobaculia bacterium]
MNLSQSLLPEFDQEMAGTRRVLERMPAEKFTWQPHPKSFALGKLATHVARLSSWATMTLATDEFDVSQPQEVPKVNSTQELLALFDKTSGEAREAIAKASDEEWFKPWSLRNGDHVVFTMPRIAVLRAMVMNHIIHHRAQLTVYLRLNDIPVPALYGPSADEGNM